MPTLLEEPPAAAPDINPFQDLIGGENGTPAYQLVGGKFGAVPKAEINTPTDYGAFGDLVPQSPSSETEKALAETPEPKPPAEADTGLIHQTLNAVRVFGNAAGKYIFHGLEGLAHEQAKLYANPTPEMVALQPEAVMLPKEQQDALEQRYVADSQAAVPAAMAREAYWKGRVAGADKQSEVDPALANTIPARLANAAGEATMMGLESLIPGAGVPLMTLHGAFATEAEALNAGKTEQQAEAAGVRSAIGLGLFGGLSKVASLGVAKLLPMAVKDPSKLITFVAQFVGQDAANETSSRAIAAWNAASDAPEGQKLPAAMKALGDWNLESGVLNSVYAGLHAAKAAGAVKSKVEAPISPASEPVPASAPESGIAPETARYAKPAQPVAPENRDAGVMPSVPDAKAQRGAEFQAMSAKLDELNRDQFLPDPNAQKSDIGITSAFSDLDKGVSDNLYDAAFDALKTGKDTISGVKDPILAKAKPFYDAGMVKSSAELKSLVQSGEINKAPAQTVSPERELLSKLGGTEPPPIVERVTENVREASRALQDVVNESRKTGLVPPGSTGVQGGIQQLGKIWRQIRDLPKFGDFKKAILGFGQKMQSSFLEAKEIQRTLKKQVPSRIAREGIFNFIEAGGDKSKLTIWRDASPETDLKRGYQAALDLTPEQEAIAGHLSDFYANKLGEAQTAGIVAEGRENYVNRIVDKRRSKGFAPVAAGGSGVGASSGGRLSKNFKHGLHRVYENSFDAERNGIRYKTKDVAELAPIYLNEMNKTIGTRNLLVDLAHGTAEDGRALAYPKGQLVTLKDAQGAVASRLIKPNAKQMVADEITGQDVSSHDYASVDHPALTGWKWVGADENGKPILIQGNLALHPEIARHVSNLLGESGLRKWYNSDGSPLASIPKGIVRNIDKAQQVAKELLFSGSGFHHANIGFHAVEHRVNPLPAFFKSLSRDYTINPREPKVQDWMQHSLQLAPDNLSARHFMEGFSGPTVRKIPIYGRIATTIADHLFERFIPALKLRLADSMFERNMKLYAGDIAANKVTPDQVKYLSAQQANSALSHINYIDIGRSPTMQHILSLTTLAPDFSESRVKFLAQAGKTLLGSKAGVEQFAALAYGAGLIWSISRVLNKISDDDYHFEQPFGVVHNGRIYNIRSIQGDVAHLITDPQKFFYGRVSPLVKLGLEQFITGTNYRGEKIGHLESLKEYLSNYVPISAKNVPGLRDLFETTKNNPVTPWESFMGAMGIQASRYSPITKTYALARDYQKEQGVEPDKGVYPVSKYIQLRYALEDGDLDRARTEYQKLIDAGEKRTKISEGFHESVMHAFTGSQANDRKFKASLSGDDRLMYDAAVKKRHEILRRYQMMRSGLR